MVRFKSKKLIRNRHAFGVPTSNGTRTTACNVCAGAEPGRKDRFIAQKCHCVSKLWPCSIQCLNTFITYYNHQKSTFCRRIAIVLNIWRSWISVSDAKMTLIWYPSKSTLGSPCWIKVRSTGKGVGQPSKLRLFGSWHRRSWHAQLAWTAPLKRGGVSCLGAETGDFGVILRGACLVKGGQLHQLWRNPKNWKSEKLPKKNLLSVEAPTLTNLSKDVNSS